MSSAASRPPSSLAQLESGLLGSLASADLPLEICDELQCRRFQGFSLRFHNFQTRHTKMRRVFVVVQQKKRVPIGSNWSVVIAHIVHYVQVYPILFNYDNLKEHS